MPKRAFARSGEDQDLPGPRDRGRPSVERILAASEQLFETRGYGDVSLRQLMAASGVSTTAFYARFDSKAAVLDLLTEKLFTGLHTEAAARFGEVTSFEQGIELGIDILCERFTPRKALVRLVIAESGSLAPTLAIRKKSYTTLVGFLAQYLRALSQRGRLDILDADATAWALVGALEMQLTRWAVFDELDVDSLRGELLAVSHAILRTDRRGRTTTKSKEQS